MADHAIPEEPDCTVGDLHIDEAQEQLRWTRSLRGRTRRAGRGGWLALIVFGAVTLGSMPFYLLFSPTAATPGCHAVGGRMLACRSHVTLFGGAFISRLSINGSLSRWATVYWVVGIVVAFGAVVLYYRWRAGRVGVKARWWPSVVAGVGLLIVALLTTGRFPATDLLPDMTIRGLTALLVIATVVLVLAAVERSGPLVVFAVVFAAVALMSCLYDDINLFGRLGIGAPFNGAAEELPNILIPGVLLILGGIGFRLSERRTRSLTR
jgi:hypothetical protein